MLHSGDGVLGVVLSISLPPNTKSARDQIIIAPTVGGYTGVPAHGGHVFCEQNNLKRERCLNVAVVSGKLRCMKYVLQLSAE